MTPRKPLVIDPVLNFFTYLGGMLPDVALHVAADATGVYVTGATLSPTFPPRRRSLSFHVAICGSSRNFPCPDVFVTKLKPDGSGLLYSTYLGGSGSDIGIGIAVDSNQQAYVVGETESMDFPTTSSGFQSSAASRLARAFLTKLSSGGSQLLYPNYLGGTPAAGAPALTLITTRSPRLLRQTAQDTPISLDTLDRIHSLPPRASCSPTQAEIPDLVACNATTTMRSNLL